MTGYGLSDDGRWHQHSWVLKGKTLQETTVSREQYFGFQLHDEEAIEFWMLNLFHPRYPKLGSASDQYLQKHPAVRDRMLTFVEQKLEMIPETVA